MKDFLKDPLINFLESEKDEWMNGVQLTYEWKNRSRRVSFLALRTLRNPVHVCKLRKNDAKTSGARHPLSENDMFFAEKYLVLHQIPSSSQPTSFTSHLSPTNL